MTIPAAVLNFCQIEIASNIATTNVICRATGSIIIGLNIYFNLKLFLLKAKHEYCPI